MKPTNTSKLTKTDLKEIRDTKCQKYLNKTVRISSVTGLKKYLFWISNYYYSVVSHLITPTTTKEECLHIPEVQTVIENLIDYGTRFIDLAYTKYFSEAKWQAYHWSESVSERYNKGDYSGMLLTIGPVAEHNYIELSVDTPYCQDTKHELHSFHKISQCVTKKSSLNGFTDVDILGDVSDLSHLFVRTLIAGVVEKALTKYIKSSSDLVCWVFLQTGCTIN